MGSHEPYRIKVGMKAYLCLPKDIAGQFLLGKSMSWMYTGNIEYNHSSGLGRAIVTTTVVEKKFAGWGYRRVIFELSNIRDFKDYSELVDEARKAVQSNPSRTSIQGIKICGDDKNHIFLFNPGVFNLGPLDKQKIPFPFEEPLYEVSWV